jgi:YtkA-like protein
MKSNVPMRRIGHRIVAVPIEMKAHRPIARLIENDGPRVRAGSVLDERHREAVRAGVGGHVVAIPVGVPASRRRGERLGLRARTGERRAGAEVGRDDLKLHPPGPRTDGRRRPGHMVLASIVIPLLAVLRVAVGACEAGARVLHDIAVRAGHRLHQGAPIRELAVVVDGARDGAAGIGAGHRRAVARTATAGGARGDHEQRERRASCAEPALSRTHRWIGALRALIAISLFGCSASNAPSGPPTFTADALVTTTGTSGVLSVAVRTSPQPPPRGTVPVQLSVTRTSDATPVDGLMLQVRPWMPAHDHGSSIVPTVADQGQGKYLVTNVDFFMPGHWELQTSISGPATDYAAPAFDIP